MAASAAPGPRWAPLLAALLTLLLAAGLFLLLSGGGDDGWGGQTFPGGSAPVLTAGQPVPPPPPPPPPPALPALPPRPPLPWAPAPGADLPVLVAEGIEMPASKWADLNKILQCYSWEGKWVPAPPGDPANATYLWAPGNCGRPWKRYSPRGLCRLLDGRKLGLVGDSMTRYVLHALDAKLTAGGPWAAPEAAWQTPGRTGSSLHPRSSPSSAPPSSDPFCGNDTDPHLLPTPPPLPDWHIGRYNKTIVVNICTPPQPLQPGDADFKCAYMLYNRADRLLVDGDPRATVNYYYSDFPWSTGLAGFPGVLVLNRGSHYENDTLYVSSWRSALSHLRRAAPRAIVFARTTPPGHENCSLIRAPLDVPQPWCGLPHHWGSFYRQNHLLGALLRDEFPGVILLDVSFATALRGDGHKGGADCLHYVTWEAGNAWADMLGNALEMVYEAAGVEVGRKEEGRVGCG